ncbi:thiol-disulfide oxidoreductase [compost metagenome]
MKKARHYVSLILGLIASTASFGQLQNGSTAPNFTLTDINGTSHTLYDYLDQGKTVYVDFFACHCPYCWSYHNTHALSDLYDTYGPGTNSNNVFVIAIELDPNNGLNEFYGISGNTQGNWISGTNYPHINPEGTERSAIKSNYAANYYPLIYAICPDRTITVIGPKNTAQLYAHISTCDQSLGLDEADKTFFISQDEKAITVHAMTDFLSPQTEIILFDIQGKQITKKNLTKAIETIDLKDLSQGIYVVQIVSTTSILYSQKIQF